jgi:hypothetical protein
MLSSDDLGVSVFADFDFVRHMAEIDGVRELPYGRPFAIPGRDFPRARALAFPCKPKSRWRSR